jgi:hypothetical protein
LCLILKFSAWKILKLRIGKLTSGIASLKNLACPRSVALAPKPPQQWEHRAWVARQGFPANE